MSPTRDSNEMSGKRGQALVELALMLPILTVILMGVIDLSFVLYAHIHVAAACNEGARTGSLFPGDFSQSLAANDAARLQRVRQAVCDPGNGTTALGMLRTTTPNFDVNTDVTVSYPEANSSTTRIGEKLVVTVTYRQPLWFDFLPGAVSSALQVASSATMRIQ